MKKLVNCVLAAFVVSGLFIVEVNPIASSALIFLAGGVLLIRDLKRKED